MKLVSFSYRNVGGWGRVDGDHVVDLTQAFEAAPSLKAALERDLLGQIAGAEKNARLPRLLLAEVTLLPVIPDPGKIICVGVNYGKHLAETGRELPKYPLTFLRPPNSQVAHGEAVWRPKASTHLDFEGELAVVIGKRGRHISRENALSHVAGWSCYLDASVRDFQKHTSQIIPGKIFYRTGGFGPWLLTIEESPDPRKFVLSTLLNGREMQRAPCSDMIFDVPSLIEYFSSITELEPGDVISTGTPEGVGQFRTPPVWMKHGDVVEVAIEGVGRLSNPVVDE